MTPGSSYTVMVQAALATQFWHDSSSQSQHQQSSCNCLPACLSVCLSICPCICLKPVGVVECRCTASQNDSRSQLHSHGAGCLSYHHNGHAQYPWSCCQLCSCERPLPFTALNKNCHMIGHACWVCAAWCFVLGSPLDGYPCCIVLSLHLMLRVCFVTHCGHAHFAAASVFLTAVCEGSVRCLQVFVSVHYLSVQLHIFLLHRVLVICCLRFDQMSCAEQCMICAGFHSSFSGFCWGLITCQLEKTGHNSVVVDSGVFVCCLGIICSVGSRYALHLSCTSQCIWPRGSWQSVLLSVGDYHVGIHWVCDALSWHCMFCSLKLCVTPGIQLLLATFCVFVRQGMRCCVNVQRLMQICCNRPWGSWKRLFWMSVSMRSASNTDVQSVYGIASPISHEDYHKQFVECSGMQNKMQVCHMHISCCFLIMSTSYTQH